MGINIGDRVRFLNDVGGGTVVKIKDNLVYVADEDGFETPVLSRECVVVKAAADNKLGGEESMFYKPNQAKIATEEIVKEAEPIIIETPEGDMLNVVLGFEASDMLSLSQSTYKAYLVNDSNYYLSFIMMTCDDSGLWETEYHGVVEPNYELFIKEYTIAELSKIERLAIQFVSYKYGRKYQSKPPVNYDTRFDATKFVRLNCFKKNVYFDKPVISYEIVKDDVVIKPVAVTNAYLQSEIQVTKKDTDIKVKKDRFAVKKKAMDNSPLVIDLHINELLDSTAGMSNADILNYQVDKFREVMNENLKYVGKKIVFIHGKGEGVLRQALMKELKYRYPECEVQDASFREYGFGATQVTIHKKR